MAPATPTRAQYERWCYPDPSLGLARCVWNDPSAYAYLYWPARPEPRDLDVLVAGCGTSEAVAMAAANPAARVVGIDASAASLVHARRLAEAHGVANLELRHLAVEDAAQLGRSFDFVSAGGVLHHLADPVAGLAALGRVLAPEGVVSAAVYRLVGREPVYALQAAFRALGLGIEAQDLGHARAILSELPPTHPLHGWIARTGEAGALDSHLVDTFLNARDEPFTVPDLLALVEGAGLVFQGWHKNALYHPDGLVPPDHPLHQRLRPLPPREVWAVMELLHPAPDHAFFACRPDRPEQSWRLDVDGPGLLDRVVGPRYPASPRYPPMPYDPRDPAFTALHRVIDGTCTVRDCAARAGIAGDPVAVAAWLRAAVAHLWRRDAVYLLIRS